MLWIKSFHILFVMAWMAGVFYLPRILVHYVEGVAAGEDTRRLVTMADKLFRFSSLMALFAIGTGVFLWLYYDFTGNWLWSKIALVVLLVIYQFQTLRYTSSMKNGTLDGTSLYFRIFNEGALMLVIPILILVEVKPF
ncbi:MAG: CopD family protein [Gammaproteobacteria bacterium]|jgi:protoporphyrinogen IX oxidase|nr:CopD family protein [Gammaproteobacteria bacterium]MBT4491633.1 CopD family protein [Gammaproteobacteria bacterium]MBT7369177.1 CopD family protein [Gammaproteobacteria bacterium]